MHDSFLQTINALNQCNEAYATAVVVRRKLPSAEKPGDKAIVTGDGKIHGWIGGGCTRGIILKEALLALHDRKPRVVHITSDTITLDAPNTKVYTLACQNGGEVEIFIEPVLPKPRLLIFGTSHIGMALSKIAKTMEYQVEVVMSHTDPDVFPAADRLWALDDFPTDAQSIANRYIIVCTQGERDADALQLALSLQRKHLSFVSSHRKTKIIYAELRQREVLTDQLGLIKTPAGLDIGAKTPHEVAISILAEIIQDFRQQTTSEGNREEKVAQVLVAGNYYINPVCQVPVLKSRAKHIVEHQGEKMYFCCDHCKVNFEQQPLVYLTAANGTPK